MSASVALFLPNLAGGGAERSMLTLSGSLAARGVAVDLVLGRAEGALMPDVPDDVRVIDLGAPRVVASIRGLVVYLRAERPDVMLSAMKHVNVSALCARALARAKTRLVVSERNALSLSTANESRWRARLLPALMRRTYPWADAVVAVSEGVADDLSRTIGLARERIAVVYNPVITPQLLARMKMPLDHPWFGAGAPPVILGVGRLAPQKDFPTLVRAFHALRQRRPARLMILGEGAERARLEALVAELGLEGAVSLPGFVSNPYPYMREAAVFALSSRWEGFANVLAEALACGTPVVSTDCPSGPNEVLEHGRWGRLVPVGDPDSLAQAIDAALDDTPDPGVAEHLAEFNVERVTDRYLEILLGAAPGSPDAAPQQAARVPSGPAR